MAALATLAWPTSAAVIHVDGGAVGGNDGTSWADAYVSLQTALEAAVLGDEIWVAAGVYYPSSYNGDNPGDPADVRRMHFRMKNGVGIYGGFAGTEAAREDRDWTVNLTTLSADIGVPGDSSDNCYRVFYHAAIALDTNSILDGFTISGANADGATAPYKNGAGFFIWGHWNGTSPQVRNCRFTRNHAAGEGGGIYIYGGNHEPANCFPLFEGCVIDQNTSDLTGAGVHAGYRANATLRRCEFIGNQSASAGGGINAVRNEIQVVDCLFAKNSAAWGGGFYGTDTQSDDVNPNITNCTIVENTAINQGGGIHVVDYPGLTLANSIVWGNTAMAGPQIYEVNADPAFIYNCIQDGGFAGAGNITDAPAFADAPGEDWRLTVASPCIDVGDNAWSAGSALDLDGVRRRIDGNLDGTTVVDMGAYEFFRTATLTVAVDPEGNGTTDPAAGVHAGVMAGVGLPLQAFPGAGYVFDGWGATAGDPVLGDLLDASTSVTLLGDATVTASFTQGLVAGLVFNAAAADVGLPGGFTAKPKVYGQYDHPVNPAKLGLKAAAKVIDKVDPLGTDGVDCEWTKKIRLGNMKAFKADQKAGESAAAWIPAHQANQPAVLHVASKEVADGDQPLRNALLAAPEILTATVAAADGVTTVTFEGNWFGIKGLKVWREYEVDNGAGGTIVKQQKLKVLKPTPADAADGFADARLKPAFMNAATGASKAVAELPAKLPKGDLNGVLVLDNGVGLTSWTLRK